MPAIAPTIGRVMWYWPPLEQRGKLPWAAHVCDVINDNMVNLMVINPQGNSWGASSVPIVQEGSPHKADISPYCEWMPYQVGQAVKHEALEKAANAQAKQ